MVASFVRRAFGTSLLFIVICLFVLTPHAESVSGNPFRGLSTAELVLNLVSRLWLYCSIFYGVALLFGKSLKEYSLALLLLQILFFGFVYVMGQEPPKDTDNLHWAMALLAIVPIAAMADLFIPPSIFDNVFGP